MTYLSAGYSHHQLQLPRRPRFRPSLVQKKFEILKLSQVRTHVYNITKLQSSSVPALALVFSLIQGASRFEVL
jgi:hypothetical protein